MLSDSHNILSWHPNHRSILYHQKLPLHPIEYVRDLGILKRDRHLFHKRGSQFDVVVVQSDLHDGISLELSNTLQKDKVLAHGAALLEVEP